MLRRLIDIRPGEGRRALLAFASLMLVIASYTTVKAVRDALFLSKFTVSDLSMVAIGLALLTGFVISIYLRISGGVARNRMIAATNITIAASLVAIWVGLFSPALARVLPWVLYIWSSIFGVFIVMQFWLLANDLFDPREAKRLFGFVGAGAILGGVAGGFLSRSLAGVVGAANLLLVAGAMLIVEAVLVAAVWRHRPERAPARGGARAAPGGASGLAVVRNNRLVRLLAYALLLATIATTLLDWQFKGIVKAHFAGRTDEMAAFFGSLYAWLSVASFGIQTLFTGGILRRFGIGVGLLMLPVSLLAGSALILVHGLIPWVTRLVAASSAKVAEGGLRFAIDKASMELMWLPVRPRDKERGKAFVDTVADRLGTGVTGFIWLGLAAVGWSRPERIHLISIAVVVAVVAWLAVLLRARKAYVVALREVLARRELDLAGLRNLALDGEVQRTFSAALASSDPREVLFSLYVLETWGMRPLPSLEPALAHEDPAVRVAALELLTRAGDRRHREAALGSLGHASVAVREAALVYLHSTAPTGPDPLIDQLSGVDEATVSVIKLGMPAYAVAAASAIRQLLQRADLPAERRRAQVELLGGAPPEMAAALLAPLLTDDDPTIVCAAVQAAGRARAAGVVREICALLADRHHRAEAAEALRAIGEPCHEALLALLEDTAAPVEARLVVLRLLGAAERADVAPLLVEQLCGADPQLSRRALRALNRLRKRTGLQIEDERIERRIEEEVAAAVRELLFLECGSWADLRRQRRPTSPLRRVVAESVDRRLESVFRLLALSYDPGDIYTAYQALGSDARAVQASTVEFLDNLLPKELSARLLPLLEPSDPRRMAELGKLVAVDKETKTQIVERLLAAPERTLQAVAAWVAGAERIAAAAPKLERLAASDGVNAAVARRALEQLAAAKSGEEEATMALTAIEKALKLQKVDVLQRASMEDLAYIAEIAVEQQVGAGTSIYGEGDVPRALHVVLHGKVRLHRGEEEIDVVGDGEAFGSWALVDESPRVASATAVEDTVLLEVPREDFVELLADRVHLVQAVLKAMVVRLRRLADVVGGDTPA